MIVDTFSIKCWDCRKQDGWGPMIVEGLWRSIAPKAALLCEPCIVRRLGRPLRSQDLRDCPMNEKHPVYQAHGRH